jgi:RecA-family ATPase
MRLVEQKAGKIAPDVLMIDTASAAFNIRNESDNSEIADLMKRLIRLARKLNCLIVILHHIEKRRQRTARLARRLTGSGCVRLGGLFFGYFQSGMRPLKRSVTVTCAKRKTGTGKKLRDDD